jgi:hypothetical protein
VSSLPLWWFLTHGGSHPKGPQDEEKDRLIRELQDRYASHSSAHFPDHEMFACFPNPKTLHHKVVRMLRKGGPPQRFPVGSYANVLPMCTFHIAD